jgi:hypothetical protein
MSAIVPPLDLIPKLPAKGVNKFVGVFDKQIDRLVDQVMKVVHDSTKLPPNLKCNDPSIKQIKDQIAQPGGQKGSLGWLFWYIPLAIASLIASWRFLIKKPIICDEDEDGIVDPKKSTQADKVS